VLNIMNQHDCPLRYRCHPDGWSAARTPVRRAALSTFALVLLATASTAFAGDEVGYADLVARLGGVGVPSGAGVPVAQVEAGPSPYGPDQTDLEFASVTFTAMSGAPGASWHATTVARSFYGDATSMAPGIANVWLYEAGSFATTAYLRTGSAPSVLPLAPPGGLRIFNNSWIGSFGSTASDNQAVQRSDFAMNRDDTLFTAGLNNGLGIPPSLLSYIFNGLSVGRADGSHSYGTVPAGYDGAGRMKPEIVAPGDATSWAAPVVGAAAALLYETAVTPTADVNPNAAKGVVIKSALMAGATHRAGWTNAPSTSGADRGVTVKPLDVIYGADLVNINNAHWILTSGEQEGSATVPIAATIGPRGWDFQQMAPGGISYYRFRITEEVNDVSILVTWNRVFTTTISAGTTANLNLRLHKVLPASTTLISLEGDGGLGVFDVGNIASLSAVDNVEHVFLRDLAPGDYVIEVARVSGGGSLLAPTSIAWIMPETPQLLGDINGDGAVDGTDLAMLLGSWGTDGIGDLNGDGIVDGDDLAILLGHWTG